MTPSTSSTAGEQAQQVLEEGLAVSRTGDTARAAQLFEQACALAPSWHIPPFMLGSEHAASGDFVRAEACFAQTVLLAPDFHIARYQLGLLQFSGGRPHVAMLTWAELRSLDEHEPFPHLVQGFAALMGDDLAAARAHFEAGLPLAAANAGLQSDVQKLLDAIAAQMGVPAQQPDGGGTHVLLSNYASGSVH